MASEEELRKLEKDQTVHRQADHLDRELEPTDLPHKWTEEKLLEALKKAQEAQMRAEKECVKLRSEVVRLGGSGTPTNKGTSGSDGKLSIASRVFRDQLIDIF